MASSSDVAAIIGAAAMALTYAYVAYWAFEIRRALAVRLYRTQALGVGLLAVSLPLAQIYYTGSTLYGWPPELSFVTVLFFTLSLLYWTNISVRAERQSDPLLRDTLGWSRLRFLVLAIVLVTAVYDSGNIVYNLLNGYAVSGTPTGFLAITFGIPALVPLVAAAVMLPAIGLRTKDPTLRKHLLWFGLFAAFLFVFVEVLSSAFANPLDLILVQDSGIILGGYCLYRSARALVPLNRISADEEAEPAGPQRK